MTKTLGMIIGRFQHLHVGHVEMIKKGLSACDKVLLLVGSSQESLTLRNPFSYSIRTEIIQQVFQQEIKDGRLYVGDIKDLTNEDDHSLEWGDYVLEQINQWRNSFGIAEPLRYMIYGNDEERQGWYRSDDIEKVSQLVLERGDIPISATKMRQFMVSGDKESWKAYMPTERLSSKQLDSLYDALREELLKIPEYQSMF
jgi:bifunctional NMN adenylyltransferase/nudix hydrolase